MTKILVVDDSIDVHTLLRAVFEPEYFVVSVYRLQEAALILKKENFDLILLDVKLPDGDGFNFCANLKQNPTLKLVPVIFITGQYDISDKAIGFSLGAEDYIVKPFNPIEVKMRCDARIVKIKSKREKESQMRFGKLRIDTIAQKIFLSHDGGEELLNLTPTGFKFLLYLVSNPEQVFSRDQLITAVWGPGTHIVDRTVDSHVAALRKLLINSGLKIEAIHGVGYKLVMASQSATKVA
jgi:two-component system, OmpR family, response regulator